MSGSQSHGTFVKLSSVNPPQDTTNGKRIRLPGRGSRCDHIDIVDLWNSTRAFFCTAIDWMCPVCGREYHRTSDVEVDELILGILAELAAEDPEEKVRAVNLNLDGSWEHVSEDPDKRLPMQRKKRPRLTLAQATSIADKIDLVNDSPSSGVSSSGQEVVDLNSD